MRSMFRVVASLQVLALVALSAVASPSAATESVHYVCPPCGSPCDWKVHDKPGKCPQCGMTLVAQGSAQSQAVATRKVAILIFDGVQIIDYTGPYEIFQGAGFEVFTVAATRAPITTVAGMTVVPRYAFAEAPPADVLVVPGGTVEGPRASAATLGWVRDTAARAQQALSVCNGAFILASAGLLDGLAATTTAGNLTRLRAEYPRLRVVEDQRWVDSGRIVTAGGLTAGIDGALHVVAKMRGQGLAQQVALGEEYDWHPAGGFARAALADMNIAPWVETALEGTGTWEVAGTATPGARRLSPRPSSRRASAASSSPRRAGRRPRRSRRAALRGPAAGRSPAVTESPGPGFSRSRPSRASPAGTPSR